VEWDEAKCKAISDAAFEETILAGRQICLAQEDPGQYFYIVKDGSFEITIGRDTDSRKVEHVGMISQGGIFGELSLVYPVPRGMTFVWLALETSVVWVVDTQEVRNLIAKTADDLGEQHVSHIEKLEFFAQLKPSEKLEIANRVARVDFAKGDHIFKMGDHASSFYVLYSGVVIAVKFSAVVKHIRATPEDPVMLGELALLNDNPRAETIEVISDTAKTLTMEKAAFENLFGPMTSWKMQGGTNINRA
jgi:CRP-like cAMP-binding protein